MSGLSKKGLSILMALLMSVSTVGVLGTVVNTEGTIVASAVNINYTDCKIGEKIIFDVPNTAEILVDKPGVVNYSTYKTTEGNKRVTLLCIAPGYAEVKVKVGFNVIKDYRINVTGTVNKKNVTITTIGKQYIVPDANVVGLFTVQGDKFISGDKFGAKLTSNGIQVWGKADTTWKLRVVTSKSATDYTIKFVKGKYEYAKDINIRKGDGNPVESVNSSNKDVVQVKKTESAYFNLYCNSKGTSTINVKYTDGRTETYDIKVRDAITSNYNPSGSILVGQSKTVDYAQWMYNWMTITSVKSSSNYIAYVNTKVSGTKVTYSLKNDIGKAADVTIPYVISLSNGDFIKSNIRITNILSKMTVNTSKTIDLKYDIASVKADNGISIKKDGTKLVVKGTKVGTYKITVTNKSKQNTVYYITVNPSNKTYNKTIGYSKDGTKITVVELKNSGAKVQSVKVDKTDIMGVTKNDYFVVLKPKKAGKATVTVTCTNGDIIKYVCTVNSLSKTYNKSVTLDTKNAKTISVEDDMKLKAKGLKITKVENKSKAIIKDVKKADYTFKYTMIKKGTATVKVTLSNGDGVMYNITVK